MNPQDEKYLQIILERLSTCKTYQPKFGTGKTVSLEKFKSMYSNDPFYSWFGLDNSIIYTAHKAAGGITSLYRQIGLGSEEVFRQIFQDEMGLSAEEATWSYKITTSSGRTQKLSLDGRIAYSHILDQGKRQRFELWMKELSSRLAVSPKIAKALDGAVFEIRQGYKSKDSKRQNADIQNITNAYAHGYLPVFMILSTQIDEDISIRYQNNKCSVLVGTLNESPFHSTYAFSKQILGYDLAQFFQRNSGVLQRAIEEIIEALLVTK